MKRKDVDYLVIAAMFLSGSYVAATGLITDLLGTHQFFLHRYAGYVGAIMVGLHIVLNWQKIMTYLRRRFGRQPRREPPTRPTQASTLMNRRGFLTAALGLGGGFVLGRLMPGPELAQLPNEVVARYLKGDVGAFYHQWSKPSYALALRAALNWGTQPDRYKTYSNARKVPLPSPRIFRGPSLEEVVETRRSRRNYATEPLSLEELSHLLHAAQGITDSRQSFRAAPSAGALYPIEVYSVVHRVTGLEPGLYHYAVPDHTLEELRVGDLRAAVTVAGIGQEMLGQAGVCFVLSAIFQRTRWRYHERTYRYLLLEAGHIGQNLYLAATSMGLGVCAIGAFLDDDINRLLGVDGKEEATLYMISVGKV